MYVYVHSRCRTIATDTKKAQIINLVLAEILRLNTNSSERKHLRATVNTWFCLLWYCLGSLYYLPTDICARPILFCLKITWLVLTFAFFIHFLANTRVVLTGNWIISELGRFKSTNYQVVLQHLYHSIDLGIRQLQKKMTL